MIVHGADGIGASSFVAAGLYPAIARGSLPEVAAAQGLLGQVDRRPLRALAEGLATIAPRGGRARGSLDEDDAPDEPQDADASRAGDGAWEAATLHEELGRSSRALTDRLVSPHLRGLVLVIDGIEEAIDSDDDREREQFAAVLAHTLAHATAPFLLVTPIRSRYLGELHRLRQLHERMIGRDPPVLYALAPIGEDALREIIRGPGERAGLVVAERLVERILADFVSLTLGPSPPPPGIVLAALAAVLTGTFRNMKQGELCVTAYEAAGGLAGAVEQLAERAIAGAIADYGERRVRQVFVTVIAGAVDRRGRQRPLTRADVIERLIAAEPTTAPREQRALAENVLRRTSATMVGLVIASERSVTLAHDILLSHWPRLRAWQAPDWRPPPDPAEPPDRAREAAAARARHRAGMPRVPGPVRQVAPPTAARVAPAPVRQEPGALTTARAAVESLVRQEPRAATAARIAPAAPASAPVTRRQDAWFLLLLVVVAMGGLSVMLGIHLRRRTVDTPTAPREQLDPLEAVRREGNP